MADPLMPYPSTARPQATQPDRRGCGWFVVFLIGAVLVGCLGANIIIHAQYRDIPNLFGPHQITYSPPQGPANAALLASRPEQVYQRYIEDYIQLAGTYPCVENLGLPYYGDFSDPVIDGKTCSVSRPVASYRITRVTIRDHGLFKVSDVLVHVTVRYVNGTRWDDDKVLIPNKYQNAWAVFWTHLDCWSFVGGLRLFGRLAPDVPVGAAYYVAHHGNYLCKG